MDKSNHNYSVENLGPAGQTSTSANNETQNNNSDLPSTDTAASYITKRTCIRGNFKFLRVNPF